LEANERWERLAGELREENVRLRAENERVSAELAVLQRLVFGRSSSGRGRIPQAAMLTGTAGRPWTVGRGEGVEARRAGGITRAYPGSR
jgi:hypothetical protein